MTDVPERLAAALAGRYGIERALGSGGMATVYLAEDLRHRRKVAVKVLRPELAATLGPDRFLREIEIAAQLQHPHILPLLDSGESAGYLYYVMPFVEGDSLRARLSRGELPVADAVRILAQVVDALAHAHSMGVVHRDIKPENVMLSGRHALVTDFGVAKAVSDATGLHTLTSAGMALGTPAYMAPEQAVADPNLDHRVDLYAVGILGYELLAGRLPFTASTNAELLGAHVTKIPDPLSTHRPTVPAELESVIMTCLEKRPADRWQTAEALLDRLEALQTPSGGTTPTSARAVAWRPASRRVGSLIGGLAVAAAAIAGWVWLGRGSKAPPAIETGARTQVTLDPGLELDPALSPDGSVIAYVAGPPGATRLFVKQMSSGGGAAVAVAADRVARTPRWSPDGARILFSSDRGVETVPFMGGSTTLVVPTPGAQGADWSPDGRRVAYVVIGPPDTLFVRPLDGGAPVPLATASELASPVWSPDGRWIAYSAGNSRFLYGVRDLGNLAPGAVWVVPAGGGSPVRVSDSTSLSVSPAWLGPAAGTLLFVSSAGGGRDVYAVRIDDRGGPTLPPRRVTTGLDAHSIAVPATGGRLAYATYSETVNAWRVRIPARGAVSIGAAEPVTKERQIVEFFDVSPDGGTLVFDSDRAGRQHIFRMAIGGGPVQQLTTGDWDDFAPTWAPDGKSIAFHSARSGDRDLFVMSADGGAARQLTSDPGREWMVDWSPDGQRLAYAWGGSIGMLTRSGQWAAAGERLDTLALRPGSPVKWSPDGRSIAFYGRGDLRLLEPGADASRVLVPAVSGTPFYLTWSVDGRFVYYESLDRAGARAIWAVSPSGGAPSPVVWFDDPARPATRFTLDANGEWLYLTLGDRQADVSVVELVTR